jgi:nicotinate-nucleotide pyrophosphorylase (carboxylating)
MAWMKEFRQATWDSVLAADLDELLRLALREDLGERGDVTSLAIIPADAAGRADVVARQSGVVAGLMAAAAAAEKVDPRLAWTAAAEDGDRVEPGSRLASIEGPARSLLAAERIMLNLLGRLSGIASLTRRYVDAVEGTNARIYDTRKTTPGWRRLEKYAVRCGGGWNHRGNLSEAILIKDNHLALGAAGGGFSAAEGVRRAQQFANDRNLIVEVEVDRLDQLEQILPAQPDIVLLDNMTPAKLREAVALRDTVAPSVELEASGGANLDTVRAIAETGVDRISVGALTHSAAALDVGLDWE